MLYWYKLLIVANTNEARSHASCTVFQGNIIVSGGIDNYNNSLNTVESYDVFNDSWSPMPNMINMQTSHSLVTVKQRLFVLGCELHTFEVFDNTCKKFVSLKPPPSITYNRCLQINNKIVILQYESSSILFFDVDKNEWSEESCEVTKDIYYFHCVKLPWY